MLPSLLIAVAALGQVASANVRPQIGYVYPPGGKAGTTVEVQLGTYDWTPDMQLLPHDSRLKLEITGPAGEPILTPPPYWFGAKAGQAQPPLPREVPAKITIPADVPPGVYRWQAANANGGTNAGSFVVSDVPEVVEPEFPPETLDLPSLPVAVSGRVSKITEIDSYRFTVPDGGLVVCRLDDRLGQPFFGALAIYDAAGKLVADTADTAGSGATVLFTAQAGATYTARVHDVEFGGDRGYVYRLSIACGPLVLATRPLVVQPGFVGPVDVIGWGVATGKQELETASHQAAVPADAKESFALAFDTPAGRASVSLAIGEAADMLEPASLDLPARQLAAPRAIAGALEQLDAASNMPLDRYQLSAKKGDVRRIVVEAARFGSPVDPSLAIVGPDGQEIARSDDLPGGTDAALDFTAPADGVYEIIVADYSGTQPSRASVYRLTVETPAEVADFSLQIADRLDVPLGGTANLAVKAVRRGAWKEPIALRLEGLPEGVSPPAETTILEGKSDLSLALTASDQAAASAALVTVIATTTTGGKPLERRAGPVLISTTLKPRCQIQSAVQDGGRLVNRGTTYPADVIVERLEGYTGPVTLQMAAAQQRQRRGMRAGPLLVPAGARTIQYPIFMPEWLETNLTCRMNVVGVTEVPDPKGNVRHIIGNMDGLIVMSLEGGLMKLSHEPAERTVQPGQTIEIPLRLSRSAKLPAAARIEVVSEGEQAGLFSADPIALAANESEAIVKLRVSSDPRFIGTKEVTIRATAMQNGQWPAVSETQVPLTIEPANAAAAQ
jgi:hypothetical protein